MLTPLFDDDPGFLQAVEDFTIEQLIPQFSIEALVVAVFPGAAGFDEQGPAADLLQPIPDSL